MGIIDNILGTKKPLIPPVYIPTGEKVKEPAIVNTEMTKPNEENYKKKYEELKKQYETGIKQPEQKPEEPEIEVPLPPKVDLEENIKWFTEKYGSTFAAEQSPVNNETVLINLIYGCLIELREINKKLDK